MDGKVLTLQYAYLRLIDAQEGKVSRRDEPLDWERVHMASCGRIAWLMALDRGADPVLAACASSIHDIGRVLTGKQAGHAAAGEAPAREFLADLGLFSEEEIDLLAKAVAAHSSKSVVGNLIEEIVKDADVVDCYQYGLPFARAEQEKRYEAWQKGEVFSAGG